ncbi:MAG: hypothetical protein AAFY91_08520 [Bacteroidota bacterium]
MSITQYTFEWQGITIDITHNDAWSVIKELDHHVQHLEIQRRDEGRLPITETGYRSVFLTSHVQFFLLREKGVIGYVREWIDHEGQTKVWRDYVEASKQLCLFG